MKERVWSRLRLWMCAKDVASYADNATASTVEVPISLLRQLRSAAEYYEKQHGGFRPTPYLIRVREALRMLIP